MAPQKSLAISPEWLILLKKRVQIEKPAKSIETFTTIWPTLSLGTEIVNNVSEYQQDCFCFLPMNRIVTKKGKVDIKSVTKAPFIQMIVTGEILALLSPCKFCH